ncbi:hypothetical protein EDD16DRAFT_1516906 [Pisolithus croceorrhizus]|nr:hypothetical protein EDD16DRAFT_1516906 [Pisolithus croceorrhizus]
MAITVMEGVEVHRIRELINKMDDEAVRDRNPVPLNHGDTSEMPDNEAEMVYEEIAYGCLHVGENEKVTLSTPKALGRDYVTSNGETVARALLDQQSAIYFDRSTYSQLNCDLLIGGRDRRPEYICRGVSTYNGDGRPVQGNVHPERRVSTEYFLMSGRRAFSQKTKPFQPGSTPIILKNCLLSMPESLQIGKPRDVFENNVEVHPEFM